MEWEVNLIEWLQKTVGNLNGTFVSALGFLGGEMGLLLVVLVILFCWKKECGKRLALIIGSQLFTAAMTKARRFPLSFFQQKRTISTTSSRPISPPRKPSAEINVPFRFPTVFWSHSIRLTSHSIVLSAGHPFPAHPFLN